jgi:fibronectin-binding autotransporter adhesin
MLIMTTLRRSLVAIILCCGLSSLASAQSTWIGSSGGEWNLSSNWNPTGVPNSTGTSVVVTGTGTVNLTSFNATVGTLTYGGTGGNAVFGTTSGTADVITLAVPSGNPVVSATNSNATIFMYANVEGTQGITKNGAGKFTFRFNPATQNYSGPIAISGGIFGIEGDQSLGNVNNSISIAHGARLTVEPGSNAGTVTLPATRTITFSSGTGQLGVAAAAVTAIVSGSVTGAGGMTKTDAGNLTFQGPVSYQGDTRVLGGSVAFTNGSYDAAGNVVVTGGTGTRLSMSALSSVTLNAPTRLVQVQPATTASGTYACEWILSAGTNSLTVASVSAGGASGGSQGSSNTGAIRLGTTNTINTGTLSLGGFNGRGEITLQVGLISPTVTFRGTAGGSTPVANAVLGDTSSGARSGEGLIDVNGATLDARFGTVVIGRHIANSNNASASGILFTSGTLDIQAATLGVMTGTSGTPTIAAAITQGGGVGRVQSLRLGDNLNVTADPASLPVFQAAYNLNGGTLYGGTIASGTGLSGTAATRTVAINGGTLRNYDASTDLVATGLNATAAGTLRFTLGPSSGTIEADAGRTVSLGAFTSLSGSGGLTKLGSGILVIGGSASYAGATAVNAGTMLVNGDAAAATGPLSAINATLGGTGTFGGAVTIGAGGVLAPGGLAGVLSTGSSVSFVAGSSYAFDFNSSTLSADLLKATGSLGLSGTVGLSLTDFAGSPVPVPLNTILSLINYGGAWNSGLFSFGGVPLADGDLFTSGLNTWQITYSATTPGVNVATPLGSGLFVNLQIVPEPTAASLVAAAVTCGIAGMLRRRARFVDSES